MTQEMTPGAAFSETQRFRQRWVWMLVLFIAALMWFMAITQFCFENPFGERFMPDVLLIVFWLLFGLGLPAMFYYGGLIVEVRSDGIYVRFPPFIISEKRLAFDDIKTCEVRTYNALKEYGGWGIKYGKGGKAYNVSGNVGVQLVFNDSKRLLIGSQRSEELCRAIQTRLKPNS
ncbi:MAG: hypothetical protein JSW34_05685 [Candidatus Zixiibacteriota bacterium]|nr:MAG: hypothetical protein JSW34_05685 [candidate division Zixibacteria bacterium]